MKTYEASLKNKRDWQNALDFATKEAKKIGEEEGRKEGLLEKGIEIAKQLKKENFPVEKIATITGLTVEEVKKRKE